MSRQRIFIADTLAATAFRADRAVRQIATNCQVPGFELYIVEQWVCSRKDPAVSIATLTGQIEHKIIGDVFELTVDEDDLSPHVQKYMTFMDQIQARKHKTPHGDIHVTNLSSFPSSLTILPIPQGKLMDLMHNFFLNKDLKRMGCSGRAGISLTAPSMETYDRFKSTYKVSDRILANSAVIELVRLCQVALFMFANLHESCCDGLLCDLTMKGILDWWRETGYHYYNLEPGDGALGPTTVAALVGLYLGSRNRLRAYGAPVPKDAFNTVMMQRGILYFQRSQHLPRSRVLDHGTLHRLHKVTQKAAKQESWNVPRAVKSTVAELGKGGEMVMGIVNARGTGIADVETTQLESFIKDVSGETCLWLWKGKGQPSVGGKRSSTKNIENQVSDDRAEVASHSSGSDVEQLGSKSDQQKSPSWKSVTRPAQDHASKIYTVSAEDTIDELKPVTTNRSGLGLHSNGQTFDNQGLSTKSTVDRSPSSKGFKNTVPRSSSTDQREFSQVTNAMVQESLRDLGVGRTMQGANAQLANHREDPKGTSNETGETGPFQISNKDTLSVTTLPVPQYLPRSRSLVDLRKSLNDLQGQSLKGSNRFHTNRTDDTFMLHIPSANIDTRILPQLEAINGVEEESYEDCLRLSGRMTKTKTRRSLVSQSQLKHMSDLILSTDETFQHLAKLSLSLGNQTESDRQGCDETMQDGHEYLYERLMEVEALEAKLEYELGVLHSKIEDVEAGVADFERQVSEIESRSRILDTDTQDHNWQNWCESLIRRIGIS